MGQAKLADSRLLRDFRGLSGRGMAVAIRLLLERRVRGRVVDQDIRAPGHLDERLVRHRVTGVHDLAPPPRRTQDILWPDRPAADRDGLALLESAVQRPARDAQRFRAIHAEPPRPRPLLDDVAHAPDRAHRLPGPDDVSPPTDRPPPRPRPRPHR